MGGEDQDMTWLDGPVASVKGKSEALERWTACKCVEKLMTKFRIDGRTIKRGKLVYISVI